MKVLVIGSGGREHSLVKKLAESPRVETVYVAPGNDGMTQGKIVNINENEDYDLVGFARNEAIDLTIVGPEGPLTNGLVNQFQKAGLKVIGPTQEAAQIEGSKRFAKDIMHKYSIPTPSYEVFKTSFEAKGFVQHNGAPIVVKADGLASGKGVTVAMTDKEALTAIEELMDHDQFGDAGKRVVIEEYTEGEEFSLMAFVNGRNVYPMIPSQDHKRVFDGDTGPNTGGMGAYAPIPHMSDDVFERAVDEILQPTADALVEEGRPFTGILYAGCILTSEGPKVIEFNARFGDPETQVVLPLMENDLVQVFEDLLEGKDPELTWKEGYCAGVVLSSVGYPGAYQKGVPVPYIGEDSSITPIYAGVRSEDGKLLSDGGRVMLFGTYGETLEQAIEDIYNVLQNAEISSEFFYRRDIGRRAIRTSS